MNICSEQNMKSVIDDLNMVSEDGSSEREDQNKNNNGIAKESIDKKINGPSTQLSKFHKIVYTSLIFYTIICSAIGETGVSPSMVDLRYILDATINQISLFYTLSSYGVIAGSLFGFLYKYVNRQITIMIVLFITGSCVISIPHSPSLAFYYIFAFIVGLSVAIYENASTVWIIEMWKEKCNPFLQLTQLAFGVGLIISPLISQPFVFGKQDEDNDQEKSLNLSTPQTSFMLHQNSRIVKVSVEERKSSLTWPFLIMGSIQLLAGILSLIIIFYKKYEYNPENEELEIKSHAQSSKTSDVSKDLNEESLPKISSEKLFNNPGSPYKLMVFLAALCLASFNASAMAHFQFGPTFSQFIPLRLSASDAALVHFFFAISFTIGRCLSIFIAIKLKSRTMLITNYVLIFCAYIVLIFSGHSRVLLIVGNVLMGFGCSSFWPGYFAFVQEYVVYTDRLGSFILFSAGAVKSFTPILVGRFIETNPIFLIHFNLTTLAVSIVSFILILINVKIYSRKVNKNNL